MKPWQKRLVMGGALGLVTVVLPRYLWFKRVCLSGAWRMESLSIPGFPKLAIARSGDGHKRLAVVAHGFLKGMRNPGIAEVAEI